MMVFLSKILKDLGIETPVIFVTFRVMKRSLVRRLGGAADYIPKSLLTPDLPYTRKCTLNS
jgi:CheY-like chemotaxis protein